MRQYSKDPKHASFVFRVEGRNDLDLPASLTVTTSSGILYTTWEIDGATVYRRQYSGRNVGTLRAQIDDVCEFLRDAKLSGTRDFITL